jgi:hypothetical protein
MTNSQKNPSKLEILGACALGAVLGAMFAYGLMGGF